MNNRSQQEIKIDLYTKTVLTVIAAALLALVLRDVPAIPFAHAAQTPSGVMQVDIVKIDGKDVKLSSGSNTAGNSARLPVLVKD